MSRKKIGPPLKGIDDLRLAPVDGGCSACGHSEADGAFRVCGANGAYCSIVRLGLDGKPCLQWIEKPEKPAQPKPSKNPVRPSPPSRRSPRWLPIALFVFSTALVITGVLLMVFNMPAVCKPYVERMPNTDFSVGCDHTDHTLTIEDGYVLCTCPEIPN